MPTATSHTATSGCHSLQKLAQRPEEDWCKPCRSIPLALIFRPTRLRRQKRYAINHASISKCPMCQFISRLMELSPDSPEGHRSGFSISTGKPNLMLSTFDTHEPWWHVLALSTSRPIPPFAWFQGEGSANAFKSDKPVVLVTCLSKDDSVDRISIPRLRSEEEQTQRLIDFDVVKAWLQTCDQKHGAACRVDVNRSRKPQDVDRV